MAVVRFDPFQEMERLHKEVHRAFDPRPGAGTWSPAVDVVETDSAFVLRAELPGMRQEDIDIELDGDTLTLRGERRFEPRGQNEHFVRVERSYGRFQRSYTVTTPIQAERVGASYRDGILEITLPKSEETRPRKVPVTGA